MNASAFLSTIKEVYSLERSALVYLVRLLALLLDQGLVPHLQGGELGLPAVQLSCHAAVLLLHRSERLSRGLHPLLWLADQHSARHSRLCRKLNGNPPPMAQLSHSAAEIVHNAAMWPKEYVGWSETARQTGIQGLGFRA